MTVAYGRTILRLRYGSHLFGTDTPSSDLDLKSIFVPNPRDILLGRVKGAISTKRQKAFGERSLAGEVEEESYSLQRFLALAAEGQTVALDILFAPSSVWVEQPAPEWLEVVANRHRLLTRRSAAFVGYCRQQANKYGIKGSRLEAARAALQLLDEAVVRRGSRVKLREIAPAVRALAARTEFLDVTTIAQVSGEALDHFDVCGRKLSFAASIKHGRDVLRRLVDEYGHRALQAETQQGVDWKALSHAVRVATEAVELFDTGMITFPLRHVDRIRAIKLGQIAYRDVADEIESLLVAVEHAAARSNLPEEVDHAWIDAFVARVHSDAIMAAGPDW